MGLTPPPPTHSHEGHTAHSYPKLVTPITKEDRHKLTVMATSAMKEQIHSLLTQTQTILEEDIQPHWRHIESLDGCQPTSLTILQGQDPRKIIQKLADEITQIAQQTQEMALQVCRTKKITHTNKTLLTRRDKTLYLRLVQTRKAIKALYQHPNDSTAQHKVEDFLAWRARHRPTSTSKPEQRAYKTTDAPTHPETLSTRDGLKTIDRDIRRRLYALTVHAERQRNSRERLTAQKLMKEKPKHGNAVVMEKPHRSTKMELTSTNTPKRHTPEPTTQRTTHLLYVVMFV